jgi:hypothetical protein
MRILILAVLLSFVAIPAMAEDSDKPVAETKEFKPPPGYKTRKRGDDTYYCRKNTEIGSRFKVESCYTQEQLQELLAENDRQRREIEQRRAVCSNPAVCVIQ